jgi:hypothetical protein
MLTIRNTEFEAVSRDAVNVSGHEVAATWDANGAHVDHQQLRAIRDAGNANWSDEEIFGLAYNIEVRLDETYTKAYRIVVADGEGWHELDAIRVVNNAAANAYAEQHYADREWYVLDADGQNING